MRLIRAHLLPVQQIAPARRWRSNGRTSTPIRWQASASASRAPAGWCRGGICRANRCAYSRGIDHLHNEGIVAASSGAAVLARAMAAAAFPCRRCRGGAHRRGADTAMRAFKTTGLALRAWRARSLWSTASAAVLGSRLRGVQRGGGPGARSPVPTGRRPRIVPASRTPGPSALPPSPCRSGTGRRVATRAALRAAPEHHTCRSASTAPIGVSVG